MCCGFEWCGMVWLAWLVWCGLVCVGALVIHGVPKSSVFSKGQLREVIVEVIDRRYRSTLSVVVVAVVLGIG